MVELGGFYGRTMSSPFLDGWWNFECYHFTLIYFRLATIINLIIAIMSATCCAGRYRHTNKFTIIYFMAELFQKDLLGSVHFA